ncbi:hypothetical protein RJT34_02194 [Clitoria ternatea]|uniref:Uncharacterized protein n=1 Tax=Clitoria ternatea TaxID=43366 RepID=A0AAN9KHV4_CLITE
MAKMGASRKELNSYTIKGTNKVVRVQDRVLIRPLDESRPPHVACVEKFEKDNKNNVKVHLRWYYRPEEVGRRKFHGVKELFLSNHYEVHSAQTIEGKCMVHSFNDYTSLENVGDKDYFCRFKYNAFTKAFTPNRVVVYCKCEMPYNPDELMVQCEDCEDWYHPACVSMSDEEAKKIENFICSECSSHDDEKTSQDEFRSSPRVDGEVMTHSINARFVFNGVATQGLEVVDASHSIQTLAQQCGGEVELGVAVGVKMEEVAVAMSYEQCG